MGNRCCLWLHKLYKYISYTLLYTYILYNKNFSLNKSKEIIIRNIKLCNLTRIRMILFIWRNFWKSIQGICYSVNKTSNANLIRSSWSSDLRLVLNWGFHTNGSFLFHSFDKHLLSIYHEPGMNFNLAPQTGNISIVRTEKVNFRWLHFK